MCLETHPDPTVAQWFGGIIHPINATMSSHYRTLAMAHFRASNIRILVCTDAAGMGCNNSDIDRVVQCNLPATFSHFIQRSGRAAHGHGRKELAVLLVEKSRPFHWNPITKSKRQTKSARTPAGEIAESDRVEPDPSRKAGLPAAERGGSNKVDAVPDGAQPLLNPESADEDPLVPCCHICDPILLNVTRPPALPPERRATNIKRGLPHQPTRTELCKWRKDTYSLHHSSALYGDSAVLDDDTITTLSSCRKLTAQQLSTLLADKWIFGDKHGMELTAFLTPLALDIPFIL
ncbi:P-loop containing nucleoside triphosphate hydrolase protein [Ganoderma leucocontextum]|nr:P-loop containing nucleoside triphosphate hydrolase protein [Ganoderma leucocontextum]